MFLVLHPIPNVELPFDVVVLAFAMLHAVVKFTLVSFLVRIYQ